MDHGTYFDTENAKDRKRRIAEQKRQAKEREARKKFELAAPDLLAACKYNQRLLTENIGQTTHAIALNKAAITKAK